MQRGKFQTAEQLWFWFMYSKNAQKGLVRGFHCTSHPCELIDVETAVTKLYLAGRLSDRQLLIMKKFGDRRRAPNPHIWSEQNDAKIWTAAMKTISDAAIRAGWIEQPGGAL